VGKLRLIELIDEEFESKIYFRGFRNFYEDLLAEKTGEVKYYSFDPPKDFLIKLSLGEEISAEDVYSSKISHEFLEKTRSFTMKKFPKMVLEKKEFLKKENILMEVFLKYSGTAKEERDLLDELKKIPFFSEPWTEYFIIKSKFFASRFEFLYFGDLREEVEKYRERFFGKEFDWKRYNQYIFEKKYKLFSKKPLF